MKWVTAESLSRAINSERKGRVRVRSSEEALTYLHSTAKPGDLMLFLGAGSIGGMADRLMERLKDRKAAGRKLQAASQNSKPVAHSLRPVA